jgi:hypothetical protein
MTPRAPDGSPLPRRHIAHFLATVAWAGATIHDAGGRLVVTGDRSGLLQAEVDRREAAIRAWWQVVGEGGRQWELSRR